MEHVDVNHHCIAAVLRYELKSRIYARAHPTDSERAARRVHPEAHLNGPTRINRIG